MINKTPFYYATFQGKRILIDEYGNETGEYELFYNDPVKSYGNISAAKGESEVKQFGENLDYDRVIAVDKNIAWDLTETSRLWIDTMPEIDAEGHTTTPHDYIVKKIAVSLNMRLIAVRKVVVSEPGNNS